MYIVQPPIGVGNTPGLGTFRCLSCNWRVTIKEHFEPLPPCGGECKKSADRDETAVLYKRVRGIAP